MQHVTVGKLLEAFTGAFFFALVSICYALLGTLSQLSKAPDGSYLYSLPTVIFLAEAVKLCISLCFLTHEVGSLSTAVQTVVGSSVMKWLAFVVPSVLYSINNNLDMLNNQYMDPATEQVLVQLKVLTTAIVWWLVFAKPLNARKWSSLVVLFLGAVCASWPTGNNDGQTKHLYIEPFGFVLVTLYCWVSALAGVYNEWLYKGISQDDSIHTSNIRLYSIGCIFNLSCFLAGRPPQQSVSGMFVGYNVYTWALVATYSLMGLLIARVMKIFDNIVKLFMSAASLYVQTFFTWAIFGYNPSTLFILSLVLVTVAMIMYNAERLGMESPKKD